MNKDTSYSNIILLLLILFVPQASFAIYYTILFIYICTLFLFKKLEFSQKKIVVTGSIVFIYLIYFFIKYLMYNNFYDFKEFVKILLAISVYNVAKNAKLEYFEKILFLYIIIDFIVSFLQFLHFKSYLFDNLINIYSTQNHISTALEYTSVRALGLSPGPGQHGVLALFIVSLFCVTFFFCKPLLYRFIGMISAFSVLMMSQSKSCMLAFIAFVIVLLVYLFIYKNNKYRIWLSILMILAMSLLFCYMERLLSIFSSLQRLISNGLMTSSVVARIDMWHDMYSAIHLKPVYVLFGAGRSYLTYVDIHNSYFDSDYVYAVVNYGVIGFFLIMTIPSYVVWSSFTFNNKSIIKKIIFMILLSGSIAGLTIAFFGDVKIIPLLSILFAINKSSYGLPCPDRLLKNH